MVRRQLYEIGPPAPFTESRHPLRRTHAQFVKAGSSQLLKIHQWQYTVELVRCSAFYKVISVS